MEVKVKNEKAFCLQADKFTLRLKRQTLQTKGTFHITLQHTRFVAGQQLP